MPILLLYLRYLEQFVVISFGLVKTIEDVNHIFRCGVMREDIEELMSPNKDIANNPVGMVSHETKIILECH